MKAITVLCALGLTAGVAWTDEIEYEIVFYFQPDRTGENTQNKSIELDADTLTIEESGEAANLLIERAPTEAEAAQIESFVRKAFENLTLAPSAEIDDPYIEVQVEFKTGAMEAELARTYPAGALPEDVLSLQRLFFEDAFQ
ncbi:MAG: hypothetical protein AAGH83_11060 [Pseudomonadota bacterium]